MCRTIFAAARKLEERINRLITPLLRVNLLASAHPVRDSSTVKKQKKQQIKQGDADRGRTAGDWSQTTTLLERKISGTT